jgi:hypothetical protein
MWTQFYNRYGDLSRTGNFERCLKALLSHKPIQKLGPDPDRIRREFWQGEPSYARLFALFHEHYAERAGKPRWGDQLAFIERYADPIFASFPNARMIHMMRHPKDRFEASETRKQHNMGKAGWHTARWLFSARLGQRNRQRYPERYRMVKYEALIEKPEETLREICTWIGEEFYPGMLSLEGAMRFGEVGLEGEAQMFGPEAEDSSARRRQMSKPETAFLQAWAGEEMSALGYAGETIRLSTRESLKFQIVDRPANTIGAVLWNVSKKT